MGSTAHARRTPSIAVRLVALPDGRLLAIAGEDGAMYAPEGTPLAHVRGLPTSAETGAVTHALEGMHEAVRTPRPASLVQGEVTARRSSGS